MGQTGRQSLLIAATCCATSFAAVSTALSAGQDAYDPVVVHFPTWDSSGVSGNQQPAATPAVPGRHQFAVPADYSTPVTPPLSTPAVAVPSADGPDDHAPRPAAADRQGEHSSNRRAAESDARQARPERYTPPGPPPPADFSALIGRLIGMTLLVLAACLASLLVAKRWLTKNTGPAGGGGKLHVLDSISLDKRCSLQLIDAEGEKLLAGLDPTGLKVLIPLSGMFEHALSQAEGNTPAGAPDAAVQERHREVLGGPLSWTDAHRTS